MSNLGNFAIPKKTLAAFCRRNHIRKLSLFGSILSDNFGNESDVDVLVEFEPGKIISLLRMAALERERLDLRTPADLSRYFRAEVIASTIVEYAQG